MPVETFEFKGKMVLKIKNSLDDKYPFSFGLAKAKKIIEHFEEIKRFVADQEAQQSQENNDSF